LKQHFSNFVGIDVSKDTLDIFSTETSVHCKISNGNKAIKALFADFNPDNTFIVLENTGGYERRCIRALLSMGFKIHRTNNNVVKAFTRSLNKKGKTDKVDARYLAMYGEERHSKLEIYEYSLYTVYGSVNIYNDYWKNFIFGGNIIEYNKEYNYYFSNDSLIIMQTQNTYSINSYKVKEKTDDKMILIYDDFELIFIKKPD